MKKFALVLAALMVLCGSVAFANEGTEMEAGVKMWYNGMKEKSDTETITIDPALMIGPAFEAKFSNNVFVEASYLLNITDFEATVGGQKITADRKDFDIAVGYQFMPEAGVFAGYKNSKTDWTAEGAPVSGTSTVSGPMIGLRGNIAVNETVGVYASAAYLMTETESQETGNPTTSEDSPGTAFELGVKAKFSEELSGTLGYKIESTKEDKTKTKETISGVTLGVMYAF